MGRCETESRRPATPSSALAGPTAVTVPCRGGVGSAACMVTCGGAKNGGRTSAANGGGGVARRPGRINIGDAILRHQPLDSGSASTELLERQRGVVDRRARLEDRRSCALEG